MWFFKRQKKSPTLKDACKTRDPLDIISPYRDTPKYKKLESVFQQADELYTQAVDVLEERDPTELNEESKQRYFDLLFEAYNKLLTLVDDYGMYVEIPISFRIEKLFLLIHRDLAACYSDGIGVSVDDYERRRHLA